VKTLRFSLILESDGPDDIEDKSPLEYVLFCLGEIVNNFWSLRLEEGKERRIYTEDAQLEHRIYNDGGILSRTTHGHEHNRCYDCGGPKPLVRIKYTIHEQGEN